jgi:hypothetical protein
LSFEGVLFHPLNHNLHRLNFKLFRYDYCFCYDSATSVLFPGGGHLPSPRGKTPDFILQSIAAYMVHGVTSKMTVITVPSLCISSMIPLVAVKVLAPPPRHQPNAENHGMGASRDKPLPVEGRPFAQHARGRVVNPD